LVLLHHSGAGHLWHQPHLGGQHDETAGHRLAHARVPQVSASLKKKNKTQQHLMFYGLKNKFHRFIV